MFRARVAPMLTALARPRAAPATVGRRLAPVRAASSRIYEYAFPSRAVACKNHARMASTAAAEPTSTSSAVSRGALAGRRAPACASDPVESYFLPHTRRGMLERWGLGAAAVLLAGGAVALADPRGDGSGDAESAPSGTGDGVGGNGRRSARSGAGGAGGDGRRIPFDELVKLLPEKLAASRKACVCCCAPARARLFACACVPPFARLRGRSCQRCRV